MAEPLTGAVRRVALAGYTMDSCPVINDAAVHTAYSSYFDLSGPLTNATFPSPVVPAAVQPLLSSRSPSAIGPDSITSVATFTRSLQLPSGALTGRGLRSVDPDEDVYVTFAWGPAGLGELSSHTAATSGAAVLNLAEGGFSTRVRVESWALIAHSAAALVGLVLLLPLGACIHCSPGGEMYYAEW